MTEDTSRGVDSRSEALERIEGHYPTLSAYAAPLQPAERKILGRDREMQLLMAAMLRPELSNVILLGEAGSGKLLPLDTPIPTPTGWTTMGELEAHDMVLGQDGRPAPVTYLSEIDPSPELYRLSFSTGDSQVACVDHQWLVLDTAQRNRMGEGAELVLTVGQMLERGVCDDSGRLRFSIPVAKPLELPEADLPLDPYVLGVWLGDGYSHHKKSARIITPDEDIVERIRCAGFPVSHIGENQPGDNDAFRQGMARVYSFRGLGTALSSAGMDEGKYIPLVYLRASVEQRLSLLQGIMDSDGLVDENGSCEISLSDERLAADVEELIHTLGIKVSRKVRSAGYRDADGAWVETKDRHRMVFTTSTKVFRLARKAEKLPVAVRKTQERIYITSIERVDSVPGRCIQVGNEDHMYLCGRGMVPTHNTALVQGVMKEDTARLYLEVDLTRMIADLSNKDEMAARLKSLFDEAERFGKAEGYELVLFIDEFHQVVQLSDAAVEALKPVLAASGVRGLRVIAATTYEEFQEHISKNQPLVERLQRISLSHPSKEVTISILRGMAERYGVADQFYDDHLYELIYEYTQRYMPASAQPRKSILVLDAMVGWHRLLGRPMDKMMLAEVLKDTANVDVAFKVDALSIRDRLDAAVFSQKMATTVVAKRLQMVVADLHDKTKPISTMLFCGSSGVGKTELVKQLGSVLFGDGSRHLIRFDMSEFSNDDSLDAFRKELTAEVWARANSIILLDEIEKASGKITRLLLQVLDDGRLSDANGREVSFRNSYIILTTNAGSEIFKTIGDYSPDEDGSGQFLKERLVEIKRSIVVTQGENRFPPELMGRIDAVVPFQPLSMGTQEKIVVNKLKKLRKEIEIKHGVVVQIDGRVIRYLIEDIGESDTDAGGARGAISKMNDEVVTEIAAYINAHPEHRSIAVVIDGKLMSENKTQLKSGARVAVYPV